MTLSTSHEIQRAYEGNEMASTYVGHRFVSELHRLLHDRQVGLVQRIIDRVRPRRTLEIAPGPGRVTREVRPSGRLVCVEFNAGMIDRGRAATAGATWVRGDGFRLPISGDFDLAYSFRFVRHFHRADRDRLYAEIRKVLKPGAWFVMDAVNERVSRPLREACPDEYPIYDKLYREEELRDELTAAGLEPVDVQPVQKCFVWQYRSQVLVGPRSSRMNRMLIRGLERLSRQEGMEWIVTCRRA